MLTLKNSKQINSYCVEHELYNNYEDEENGQFLSLPLKDPKKGLEIFEHGLLLKDKEKSGILSTFNLLNDKNNRVNFNNLGDYKNDNQVNYSLIVAMPIMLDKIYLGHIHNNPVDFVSSRSCILDALGLEKMPKEFIFGISKYDKKTDTTSLIVNPYFFTKNMDNQFSLINKLNELIRHTPDLELKKFINYDPSSIYYLSSNYQGNNEIINMFLENLTHQYQQEVIQVCANPSYKMACMGHKLEKKLKK